jgi:hypothetical protein
MAEEDLVLYLGYHMLKHDCRRLLWAADLSRVFAQVEKNRAWETQLKAARRGKMERLLLCTCLVVQEVLGRPLPPELSGADPELPEMRRRVHGFFETQTASKAGAMRFPEIWWPEAPIEAGAWIRWHAFDRLLPTWIDREWAESCGFPKSLLWLLLPLLRPIRILRKYGFVRAGRAFFYSLHG